MMLVTIDCMVSDRLTVNFQPEVPPAPPHLVDPPRWSTRRRQAEPSTLVPPLPPLPAVDEERISRAGRHFPWHYPYICSMYITAVILPPIPDSPSNPFWIRANEDHTSPGYDVGHETWSSTPISQSGESFAQASPSSSMGQTPPQQSRGAPRVGRHSTVPNTVNRPRPAATGGACATPKRKKGARNVWTFFKETKDGRFCVFCK